MANTNITFVDYNETTLYEQTLAKLIARTLLFQVRLEKESDNVKQEKKENARAK